MSDTAALTVTPAALDHIVVSPATAVISAGEGITYTAEAFDVYDNSRGDVTAQTVFTIPPASGGSFVGNVVTPTVAATWTVTGSHSGVSDTAALTVTPAALDHIVIRTAPNNGGTEVTTHTMTIYDTYTAYAAGYDVYDNYKQDYNATWSGTGVLASGSFAPNPGISTTFTPAPILSGTGTIVASYGGFTDATDLFTIQAPYLIISKVDSEDPVGASESLMYTIIYTNVGNATARNVRITETYDANVTFASAGPPPDEGNNVWTRSTLAVGSGGTIYVFVNVANSLISGTLLTNQVVIGGSRLAEHTVTETTVVHSMPDLQVSLSDSPDPVDVGQNLVYTIRYSNTGTAPLHNVRITMTYDANVTFVSANPSPYTGTNNVWVVPTLEAGKDGLIYVTVRVTVPLENKTVLLGQVVANSNETPSNQDSTVTTVYAPSLALRKEVTPNPAPVLGLMTYTLVYSNTGDGQATGVVLTDAVPTDTTFESCAPAAQCDYDTDTGIVTWNPDDLPAHQQAVVTLTVRVNNHLAQGTVITNQARFSAMSGAYSATAWVTSSVDAPLLVLSKAGAPNPVAADGLLTYTFTFTNVGPADAHTLLLTDTLDPNTSFQSCAPAPCAYAGGIVSWQLGDLGRLGGQGTATLVVKVANNLDDGVVLTNSARLAAQDDGYPTTAWTTVTVSSAPDLWVSLSDGRSGAGAGERLTYNLTYGNAGNGPAYSVRITFTLPEHSSFDGCLPVAGSTCSLVNSRQVVLQVNRVDADTDHTAQVFVKVDETLPAGTRFLTATVVLTTPTPGDPSGNNSAQDVDAVTTHPDLQISVDYVDTPPYPGKVVTFTVHYTNNAAIGTTGVVLTATKPPSVTYVGPGALWQESAKSADILYLATGDLPAWMTGTQQFAIQVPLTFTREMTNFDIRFSIGDSGISGAESQPSDNQVVAPLGVPDLTIVDVVVEGKVWGNQSGVVQVVIKNQGTGTACNSVPGPGSPPDFCAPFFVDLYVNPDPPPQSYPYDRYGEFYSTVEPIPAGKVVTIPIAFSPLAVSPRFFYVKVDNFKEDPSRPYSLVPEYEEYNNVFGPVYPPYNTFLPLVIRGR